MGERPWGLAIIGSLGSGALVWDAGLLGCVEQASVGPVQEVGTWVEFGPKFGSNWAQQNNKTNSNINKIKYDKQ